MASSTWLESFDTPLYHMVFRDAAIQQYMHCINTLLFISKSLSIMWFLCRFADVSGSCNDFISFDCMLGKLLWGIKLLQPWWTYILSRWANQAEFLRPDNQKEIFHENSWENSGTLRIYNQAQWLISLDKFFVVMFDILSLLSQNFCTMFQLLKINLQFLIISCHLNGRLDPKWQRILLCLCGFHYEICPTVPQLCFLHTLFSSMQWYVGLVQLSVLSEILLTEASYTALQRAACINRVLLTQ